MGDVSIRESSDIDVLIDSKDIAQLDLVLKSIGFSQIAQFDDMSFSNKLAVKYLQAMYSNHQLPPTKKKTHDVQYRPYYSKRLGIRIEVHDGIYYVPSCYIPEMIWHTCILKLPNCSVRQLDLEHSLAVLILTAYENSENIYAGFDGEANLRDYCDIVSFFKLRGRDLDIDRFREITKNLNIENILEIVSRNMQIIFGFTPFKGIGFSIETNLGITEQTLLERLFDKQANRAYAKKELKRRVLESQTVVNEGEIVPVPTIHNLGIGVRIYRESSNIVVEWIVPISIKHDLSFLGLQLGIVSTSDSPFVEGLASISDASRPNNAVWSTKERACQILIRTKQLGTALETFKEEHDSVIVIGAIIPIELIATDDCELGIVPMVYVKASSNSYRTINISSSHFENPWLLSWKDRCPPASPAR